MGKAFAAGDWIELAINPDLTGWMPLDGPWLYEADHKLKGRVEKPNGRIRILSAARFGHRFEYEGDIEIDEANAHWATSASVIYAWATKPVWHF